MFQLHNSSPSTSCLKQPKGIRFCPNLSPGIASFVLSSNLFLAYGRHDGRRDYASVVVCYPNLLNSASRERERNAMEKIQLSGRFSYIVVEKVLQDCMAVGSNSATAGRKDDKEDGKGQYFHKKRSRSK